MIDNTVSARVDSRLRADAEFNFGGLTEHTKAMGLAHIQDLRGRMTRFRKRQNAKEQRLKQQGQK